MGLLWNALAAAVKRPSAPSVSELSEAVANVNDWRALGLFAFAFMLVLLALVVWLVISLMRSNKPVIETVIPVRIAMEAAKDAVQAMRGSLDSLVNQIAILTGAVGQCNRKGDEIERKLDDLASEVERLRERSTP